jgi:TPP-dependent indolepyruvate ferredoxin oxidoreductase alpha subunit
MVQLTDLGNGKRLLNWDYDSSSGSTMVYRGQYEGPVTEQDIIDCLGDGTFGHRGPTLGNGRFTYTKITD